MVFSREGSNFFLIFFRQEDKKSSLEAFPTFFASLSKSFLFFSVQLHMAVLLPSWIDIDTNSCPARWQRGWDLSPFDRIEKSLHVIGRSA